MAKAYVTLGFYNQSQKLLVLSAYCLFWEKKKANCGDEGEVISSQIYSLILNLNI